MRRITFVLSTLVLVGAAEAAVIYRWVDAQGRTHFSDVVPEAYKRSAEPVDTGPNEPSPEQRREAQERAAQQKARAAEATTASPDAPAAQTPSPSPSGPTSKRPPVAPNADTDCETWRYLYNESLACFGPYRTARGTTKAEAYQHCTEVVAPPIRCGRTAR